MEISKLITYTFSPNVGTLDRAFRIFSGLALAALPWIGIVAWPQVLSVVATVFGFAWFMTGVLSRCGLYYLLGLSSRRSEG